MAVLLEPGGVTHRAGDWGRALQAGAAHSRPDVLPGSAHRARGDLVLPGRLHPRPDTPGASDHPHRPDSTARSGAPLRLGPWGDVSGRRGAWAIRPRPCG